MTFRQDVLRGLAAARKSVPCTWLYDRRGSELFEQITALPEYYPTRTEARLLDDLVGDLARRLGPGACVVELGSGSSTKTRTLLRALVAPAHYMPVDISEEFLRASLESLAAELPRLALTPVVADFARPFALPPLPVDGARLGFFPGSTIGNFAPDEAVALLASFAHALGDDAWLLIGVDHTQDAALLVPAYDDAQRVTAAFNLNLLARINRELAGDFALDRFHHVARFDALLGRIEMHLVSEIAQTVRVGGQTFRFTAGESIHTENAYKYGKAAFEVMAAQAGWSLDQSWADAGPTGFTVWLARRSQPATGGPSDRASSSSRVVADSGLVR